MILPSWWPRTCCIYCGERIPRVYDVAEGRLRRAHPLACPRHQRLVSLDPLLDERKAA